MPKKPELPPIDLGKEKIGQRLARLRKEKALTQKDLAERIGISRSLICDYEIGRIRLYDEMVARFANALGITADKILGLKQDSEITEKEDISLRYTKRIKRIEKLPEHRIKTVLKTLDAMIKGNEN